MTDTSKFEAPLKDEETLHRVMTRPAPEAYAGRQGIDRPWQPEEATAKGPTLNERVAALEARIPELQKAIDRLSERLAEFIQAVGV